MRLAVGAALFLILFNFGLAAKCQTLSVGEGTNREEVPEPLGHSWKARFGKM